jgi:hypothetical protein
MRPNQLANACGAMGNLQWAICKKNGHVETDGRPSVHSLAPFQIFKSSNLQIFKSSIPRILKSSIPRISA